MSPIRKSSGNTFDRHGNTVFWVAPDVEGVTDRLLSLREADLKRIPDTVVLKENRHRAVFRVTLPFMDGPLLVKSFRYPSLFRAFKGMVASYGARELRHALETERRGVPVASPLFFVERRQRGWPQTSLLAYRFLEGISLYEFLSGGHALTDKGWRRLMHEAGAFTALLHDRGVVHKDYHAGNLLIQKNGSVLLVDLYPVFFSDGLGKKDRVEGLAHLAASLAPLVGEGGVEALFEGYRASTRFFLDEGAVKRIWRRVDALRRRHEASRSKRCLKNSSQFYVTYREGARVAARREITPEDVFAVLEAFHRKFKARPMDALKNAPESVILKVDNAWRVPLCVKWYRKRGEVDQIKEWMRGGRALRAWKGGNALMARGFPVAVPYAVVRTTRGGFLFMAAVEGEELDRKLDRMFRRDGRKGVAFRRGIAEALGELIGRLHRKGIYHADLKACNIMVVERGDQLEIKLLDYDHVTIHKVLPDRLAIKNLTQINTSVPEGISRALRFRFLTAYRAAYPEAPSVKELFRKVWLASREAPIVYVTDEGDRITSWRS